MRNCGAARLHQVVAELAELFPVLAAADTVSLGQVWSSEAQEDRSFPPAGYPI